MALAADFTAAQDISEAPPLLSGGNSQCPPGNTSCLLFLTTSSPQEAPGGNQSVEELLEAYLGGRYRNLTESIVLTMVYSIIFITGVVGNVCTCIVIIKNSYMHTATNYYLFSLAISDVLTLILGLPPELYTIWEAYPWRLGEPYCLFKVFLTEMTSCASILTITAFTVERYVAICHPIRAQRMSSLSRAIKIIALIWVCASLAALPYPIHTRTYHYVTIPHSQEPIPDSLICNIPKLSLPTMRYVFQISTFLLFVTPMTVISVLYIMIGLTLRQSALVRQTSNGTGSPPQGQSRRTVLKMLGCTKSSERKQLMQTRTNNAIQKKTEVVHAYLVAVVVAFFICWAPFHTQRLMTIYVRDDQWTETLLEIQSVLFYTSGVLYFISSTVNPILYNLMSRKYRQAFKETLCRCCLTEAERHPWRNGRNRYYTDRSTYSTYTAHSTRLANNDSTRKPLNSSIHKSVTPPNAFDKKQTNGKSSHATDSWSKKWFKSKKRDEKKTANGCVRTVAPNGSCSSASSSPGVMAAHIKEEMELTSMLVPENGNTKMCPAYGDASQGTML